jgi:hypothetical protein
MAWVTHVKRSRENSSKKQEKTKEKENSDCVLQFSCSTSQYFIFVLCVCAAVIASRCSSPKHIHTRTHTHTRRESCGCTLSTALHQVCLSRSNREKKGRALLARGRLSSNDFSVCSSPPLHARALTCVIANQNTEQAADQLQETRLIKKAREEAHSQAHTHTQMHSIHKTNTRSDCHIFFHRVRKAKRGFAGKSLPAHP